MTAYDPAAVRSLVEKLRGKHIRVEESGCWTWLGRMHHGAPVVRLDGVDCSVRRVLHNVQSGESVDGKRVRMTCGNAACVNPDHMA